MASTSGHHALIIGASGLIGWAVVNQLLQPYPSPSPFRKVTALVNRPLKLEDSFWPDQAPGRPELALASGVNLLCEDDEFEGLLKEKVDDVESVSHVFYFAFKEDKDAEREVALNVAMMRRLVRGIKHLSNNFQFFVYPGGTRGYGIYRPDGIFTPPLTEAMADTLPEDYLKTVSYPHYRAMLTAESIPWCELVPDAIIGFTPHGSGFSLAGHWAAYLSTYALVHGAGSDIPFPGNLAGYDARFTETSSATLARVGIYAALNGEKFQGRLVNVADSEEPSTMRVRWPQIVGWFGLRGVEPREGAGIVKPSEFIEEHKSALQGKGVKGVDIWNQGQLDSYGYWLTFDRQLSLERLRGAGFGEVDRPEEGWWGAFAMFKRAGMIV